MNIKLDFENVLFLDIETVPEIENFSNLTADKQVLFEEKNQTTNLPRDESAPLNCMEFGRTNQKNRRFFVPENSRK